MIQNVFLNGYHKPGSLITNRRTIGVENLVQDNFGFLCCFFLLNSFLTIFRQMLNPSVFSLLALFFSPHYKVIWFSHCLDYLLHHKLPLLSDLLISLSVLVSASCIFFSLCCWKFDLVHCRSDNCILLINSIINFFSLVSFFDMNILSVIKAKSCDYFAKVIGSDNFTLLKYVMLNINHTKIFMASAIACFENSFSLKISLIVKTEQKVFQLKMN